MSLTFSELQDLIRVRSAAIWTSTEGTATVQAANGLIEAAMEYKKLLTASKKSKGKK